LLKTVEALNGGSATFDSLNDSGSVGLVGGEFGSSGGFDKSESGRSLLNSSSVTIENILFTMSGVTPCSDFSVTDGDDTRLLTNNSLLVVKHQCVLLSSFSGSDLVASFGVEQELSQLVESGEESGVVGLTCLHFDSDKSGHRSSQWGSLDLLKDVFKEGLLAEGEEVGGLVLNSVGAGY
jgi:hypothetical protein